MNFGLTEKQQRLVDSVSKFCQKEFDQDYATKLDRNEEFPTELYQKAALKRFSSQIISKKFDGGGQGYLEDCLVMEEMCRADSSLGLACMIGNFGSEIILYNGTEVQKNKYLPLICRGEIISAAAFTEPLHGTDLRTIDTTALKQDREWLINGKKTLITNAPIADFITILCQTSSKKKPRRSQTLFIIDKKTPGVSVIKLHNKMGTRCVSIGEVLLENVKVDETNILGELNNGYYHSVNFFTLSRTTIAAQAVGTAQGALEIALNYAKKRKSAGQPIIRFQQIGSRLAQIATEIEAARLLMYKAASSIDQNEVDPMLTSMAKLFCSNVAVRAADAAIQTLGGYGYLGDYKVERYYRDAKVTEIYEGTSEIQKLAVLKQLIKLY